MTYFTFTTSLLIFRGIVYALFLGVVANGIREAQDMEFDERSPFEVESIAGLEEITLKLDRFTKQIEALTQDKLIPVNKKIVIWMSLLQP